MRAGPLHLLLALALARAPRVEANPLSPFQPPRVDYAAEPAVLPLVTVPGDRGRMYAVVSDPVLGDRLFFLDTGYAVTTCDDDFIRGIGRRTRPVLAWAKGELGRVGMRKAVLPRLSLGGHVVHRLSCAVRDLGTTSSIPDVPEAPVAGVLGANLLFEFRVEIDPEKAVLRLWDPRSPTTTPETSARMRREHGVGWRRVVEVELDGEEAPFVLDTGDTAVHFDARRLDLRRIAQRAAVVQGTGSKNRKKVNQELFIAESASLAGMDLGALQVIQRSGHRSGLLGMPVYRRFAVTLDPKARRLSLVRVPSWGLQSWPDWLKKELERRLQGGDAHARLGLVTMATADGRFAEALALSDVPDPSCELALARAMALGLAGKTLEETELLRATVKAHPNRVDARLALGLRLLAQEPASALPWLEGNLLDLARYRVGATTEPLSRATCADDPLLCALWRESRGEPPSWDRVARLGPREALLALDRGASPATLLPAVKDPVARALIEEASGVVGASVGPCVSWGQGPDPTENAFLAIRCGRVDTAMTFLDRHHPPLTDGPAMGLWFDAMAEVSRRVGTPEEVADLAARAIQADPTSAYLVARAERISPR